MRAVFQQFLKNTFDIREGEVRRAVLMQLNIFLIISTLLIIKPTVTGLFLSELGIEKLPLAFLFIAFAAVLISTIYNRLLGKRPLIQIINFSLILSIGIFIVLGSLLYFGNLNTFAIFGFYIWVAIFGVLVSSQFWILANMVFNVREAKRLFGFIGSGAIAGGIFGGYFTTLTAEYLGSAQLIFFSSFLLSLCIPLSLFIWKNNVLVSHSSFQRQKNIPKAKHPLSLIRKSPHLSFMAAMIGVSVIVARLVDYQFNAIATANIKDPEELTAFLGFWFSTFNLVSLGIQLLLTRRVVGRFGVSNALLILPLAILLSTSILFFLPVLSIVIIVKMFDGSLKQSIHKAAVELLSLPIPKEIKSKTKTFIDLVVDSVATGIGGLLLIFVVNGLQLSTQAINILILVFVSLWIFFVFRIRKTYVQSFKINIQRKLPPEEQEIDLKNVSIVEGLSNILKTGSDLKILFVLQKLQDIPEHPFIPDITPLLLHPSNEVKIAAIRNLYFNKQEDKTDSIQALLKEDDFNLKVTVYSYLISRSIDKDRFINEKFRSKDQLDSLAFLLAFAQESRDNPVLQNKFQLSQKIEEAHKSWEANPKDSQRTTKQMAILRAIGWSKETKLFHLIESAIDGKDPTISEEALIAAGLTLHPSFVPQLIQALGQKSKTTKAVEALQNYGISILPILKTYYYAGNTSVAILKNIPAVVAGLKHQQAADLLFEFLSHKDRRVRLAALRAFNKLKLKFPYLYFYPKETVSILLDETQLYQDTLSILYAQQKSLQSQKETTDPTQKLITARKQIIELLESRLDQNLERIFRLLGLKYPIEDVISVYENIQNPQQDMRTNALEYLDNILEPSLKRMLIPIAEIATLDGITETIIKDLKLRIPNEEECFQKLLERGDEEIIEAVQQLKSLHSM